jgi:hypothetical protein
VYQSRLLDTDGHEAPETTWPGLDELLTPLEGCNGTGAEACDEPCDEETGEEELDVFALAVLFVLFALFVPGMVSALTKARPPTPASAPIATPAVKRFSFRRAASRAALASNVVWLCILEQLGFTL